MAAWTEMARRWLSSQRDIFYLDSCSLPDAGGLGSYELVIGQGIRSQVIVDPSTSIDWPTISDFCRRKSWKFFVLSYDLNAQMDGKVEKTNPDHLDWPLACLVEPARVLTLSKLGILEIFAEDPESLLAEISGSPASNKPLAVRYASITDSIQRDEYFRKIACIQENIADGVFYEINLCVESIIDELHISNPFLLHTELIRLSPTPFSCYVQLGPMHLLSASPERFIRKHKGTVYSQPIKGTSARHSDAARDEASRDYLINSLKERAEHIMIVDLMRNDLGRFCRTGSVRVTELCGIYGYRQVYQMISTIAGDCEESADFIEILKASFPMGSMTGAPKGIVMQFIEQLETAARGWYSGSVGYITPDGDFDSNVIIRSLLYDAKKNVGKYSVGSAITHDSNPHAEYDECLLKSSAIRTLLTKQSNTAS